MSKGINAQTIEKLNAVCETFYDGQLSGNSEQALLDDYKRLLDIREDMRQQSEPIGGRFIVSEDRMTITHALDAIHCTIIGRMHAMPICVICSRLECLLAYLRGALKRQI